MKFDASYVPELPDEIKIDLKQIELLENFFKYYASKRRLVVIWVDFKDGKINASIEKIREINNIIDLNATDHIYKIWSNITYRNKRWAIDKLPEFDLEKIKVIIKDVFRSAYENNKRLYQNSEWKTKEWIQANIFCSDNVKYSLFNDKWDKKDFNDFFYKEKYLVYIREATLDAWNQLHQQLFILINTYWMPMSPKIKFTKKYYELGQREAV